MHERIEQALAVLFPEGIPAAKFAAVNELIPALEGLITGVPGGDRNAKGWKGIPSVFVSHSGPASAFLTALRAGATTPQLAKVEGLSEQAVRTRISRLKVKGYKIESRNVQDGSAGRPAAFHKIVSEPKG